MIQICFGSYDFHRFDWRYYCDHGRSLCLMLYKVCLRATSVQCPKVNGTGGERVGGGLGAARRKGKEEAGVEDVLTCVCVCAAGGVEEDTGGDT